MSGGCGGRFWFPQIALPLTAVVCSSFSMHGVLKKKKTIRLCFDIFAIMIRHVIATNKAAKWPTAVPVILPVDIFEDTW